jgi:hypothetical protein
VLTNQCCSALSAAYDLEKGEFLPPYGNGVTVDFEVNYSLDYENLSKYTADLKIRFPNVGDGLIPFYIDSYFSDFKSAYMAPMDGYIRFWELFTDRSPEKTDISNFDRYRNYYFRVRSEYDENGDLVSAHYGKIYGEFLDISHYFNPNENDRNIEFDPKQNLFINLTKDEKVWEP